MAPSLICFIPGLNLKQFRKWHTNTFHLSRFSRIPSTPAPEVASDIADLKREKCESRTVTLSPHNPKDYSGALPTSGFSRSAGSPQGRAEGASNGIPAEIEGAERYRNSVETRVSLALGVRGYPKSTLPKTSKYLEIMVSADGLEPSTHALKGHCSAN
jgi:hypothetical protein